MEMTTSPVMRSVGIFSGSFNPIHIGHLALANYICEFEEPDEVWFLVTPQTPYGNKQIDYPFEQRMEWVRTAIGNYPRFKVSDFENHLPQPHHTIYTLRALQRRYPGHRFSLIIGADNWAIFDRWKESEALLNEFQVIVYPRKGYNSVPDGQHPAVRFCAAPLIEISSTFIRENTKAGKCLRFFLPEGVVL
jgi:nicotinate-nucleotide adenylyltransferase